MTTLRSDILQPLPYSLPSGPPCANDCAASRTIQGRYSDMYPCVGQDWNGSVWMAMSSGFCSQRRARGCASVWPVRIVPSRSDLSASSVVMSVMVFVRTKSCAPHPFFSAHNGCQVVEQEAGEWRTEQRRTQSGEER
eukprot:1189110-Prorocentrum_minimum.AAC.2